MSNKSTKTVLFLLAIIVLSLIASAFFILGLIKKDLVKTQTLDKKLTELESELQNAQNNKVDRFYREHINNLQSYVLSKEKLLELLSFVEGLSGGDFKVSVENAKIKKSDSYNVAAVDIAASAPLKKIMDFLDLLETLPYVGNINFYHMEKASGKTGVWNLNVSMNFLISNK